jgi:hypothetical protein
MDFEVLPKSYLITKYVYRPPESTSVTLTDISTICHITHQSNWIENGQNITQNSCLQGKKITLMEFSDISTYYVSLLLIPTQ